MKEVISLKLPARFAMHTEPFRAALREELFRAYSEYGHIEFSEISNYEINIEVEK